MIVGDPHSHHLSNNYEARRTHITSFGYSARPSLGNSIRNIQKNHTRHAPALVSNIVIITIIMGDGDASF